MANLSDFDFDELDKAVAGALSDTRSDVRPEAETPVVPAPVQSEEPKPAPVVARPPAPAARRSAGRFMDVVHPSSDMRTKSGFTPPVSTPAVSAQVTEVPQKPVEAELEDWVKPLESPFLPDAKVEKRPLGTMPATGDASKEDELLLEAPDDPLLEAHAMPDPIDFAAHASALPSEQEDTGVPAPVEAIEGIVPEEVVAEEVAQKPIEVETKAEEPVAKVEEVIKSDEPVGPASISQQYTEQPSTSPESGAIYDTESYHQPLAAAPKKKSGAWVFVWILLLLIVGAAAGAGFYFFVLPML